MIYLSLFYTFFRIGLFGFGGGLAILPLILQSVQEFGFMSAEEFANLVALAQVTPGPVAVNAATYVGYNFAGLPGAFFATLGISFPCFFLTLTAYKFLKKFKESRLVASALKGIRPAAVGLISSAVIFVGSTSLLPFDSAFLREGIVPSLIGNTIPSLSFDEVLSSFNILPWLVFFATILLVTKAKLSSISIIFIMAAVGLISTLFI